MDAFVKSVLLIGLGNVGVGYDISDELTSKVLSHARAFSRHPDFRLVGGVDPNVDYCRRFHKAYCVQTYTDIATAICELSPDVVVVATPTVLHLKTINSVFEVGRPKAMLCEKPLAYDLSDAHQIVAICAQHDCALYVNFFRQVEPGVAEIRARISDGSIERPFKGVVWYSKGIFNSGVHFLSLLQSLLGEVVKVNVLNPGRKLSENDLEPDVEFFFPGGQVVFLAAREENFFHNTIELIAPNGRLRYEFGGARINWQGIEEDARFNGYKRLSEIVETISVDFDRIQWYVIEQLAKALEGQSTMLCTGADALRTQVILDIIKEKS